MQFRYLLFSSLACSASAVVIGRRDDDSVPPTLEYISNIAKIRHATPNIPNINPDVCTNTKVPDNSDLTLNGLPAPSTGYTVYHVAIGRGIQNYTCGADPTAPPSPIGAVATLFNVTCQTSFFPQSITPMPSYAVGLPLPNAHQPTIPGFSHLDVPSGHHYFSDRTTATFNLNTGLLATNYGITFSHKIANVSAPATAAQAPDGSKAVPWLKLKVEAPVAPPFVVEKADAVGAVMEIYRVNTAGGAAPATCVGMEGKTVSYQYAAEYWFFH